MQCEENLIEIFFWNTIIFTNWTISLRSVRLFKLNQIIKSIKTNVFQFFINFLSFKQMLKCHTMGMHAIESYIKLFIWGIFEIRLIPTSSVGPNILIQFKKTTQIIVFWFFMTKIFQFTITHHVMNTIFFCEISKYNCLNRFH